MWGHYGSKVMGVYSGPFSGVLGLIINFLWWYKLFIYGKWCIVCFSMELGFNGFIYVLQVFLIFNKPVLEEYVYQFEGGAYLF